MKRFGVLLLIVMAIPAFGLIVGSFAKYRAEQKYIAWVKQTYGEVMGQAATNGKITLESISEKTELANDDFVQNYNYVRLLRKTSAITILAGIALPFLILVAGWLASLNRRLLLVLFAPGLKVVLLVLFALILSQGTIATYGLFILETSLSGHFHPILIGSIGLGSAVVAISMIVAGFSISKKASIRLSAIRVTRTDEPRLWEFVEGIANTLRSTIPKNIVVGLEPNFFATNAEVTVYPEGTKFSDETLYLSLPFIRIFSINELKAVVGHELGHFRGDDTRFSLKFYPIYVGTSNAIKALASAQQDTGGKGAAGLPAFVMLMFFMERFAIAENKISRYRELQADKAGAEVASSQSLVTSLLKLGAFSSYWPSVKKSMINALNQGKAIINASSLYAETAIDSLDAEVLFSGINSTIPHPIDSHPTIGQRITNLGLSVEELKANYVSPESHESAVSLFDHPVEIEERITDFEHQVILALGQAKLPQEEPAEA